MRTIVKKSWLKIPGGTETVPADLPRRAVYLDENIPCLYIGTNNTPVAIGLKGEKGDSVTGPQGIAGQITIRNVYTGAPGTSVIIQNIGTAEEAVLDITIPRGNPGADGTGSGDMVKSTYDTVGDGVVNQARAVTDKAITLAKMADMATASLIGRKTAATGVPEVLSAADARAVLNVADGANNYTHPTTDGNIHLPANSTTNQYKVPIAGAIAGTWTLAYIYDAVVTGFNVSATAAALSAADTVKTMLEKLYAYIVAYGTRLTNLEIVTANSQTASYTLVLSDANKLVEISNANANTLTVPPNSSVAFPVGTKIDILQTGAGQTTITAGSGVTINAQPGLKLSAQWAGATLIKRATDTWVAIGGLSA